MTPVFWPSFASGAMSGSGTAPAKSAPKATTKTQTQTPTDLSQVVYDSTTNRFNFDGEHLTLTELLFKVTSKAAQTAKSMLAVTAQNLADANTDGEAALAWRNKLAALEPTGSDKVSAARMTQAAKEFRTQYGFDPMAKYDLTQYAASDGSFAEDNFAKMNKATESYISTVSNNQSKINLDVERYTHVVTEANELTASVNKSISDVLTTILNKTG
jgi:hypothetical protein